jgi:hypothetical protein
MELPARSHGFGVGAFGWLGDRHRRHERDAGRGDAGEKRDGQRRARLGTHHRRDVDDHVDEAATGRREAGGHERSKPRVIVFSWSAESVGPRIIAAPQRGHAQVATVDVSVAVDGVATVGRAVRRSVRARVTRVVRQCSQESPTAECRRSRAAKCAERSDAEGPSPIVSSCATDSRARSPSTGR